MSGLSRFDFYPRDWFLDTRDLSNAAKGVYVDLLAAIYGRGGPLPNDERELCALCGCATVRSLRPLLDELIGKGKLKLVDGHLTNGRATEEIAKAETRQSVARKGGKAKAENHVPAEYDGNTSGTHRETEPDIAINQRNSLCSPSPSPSPSLEEPSPTEKGAGAPLVDPEKELFTFGKSLLGEKAGGLIVRLKRHHDGDVSATLHTLRLAGSKESPAEYIGAILRGDRPVETDWDAEYRRMGVSL